MKKKGNQFGFPNLFAKLAQPVTSSVNFLFKEAIKNIKKEIDETESSTEIKNDEKYQILEQLAYDLKININNSIDSSLKLLKLNFDSNQIEHSSSSNWKDTCLNNFSKLLDHISK